MNRIKEYERVKNLLNEYANEAFFKKHFFSFYKAVSTYHVLKNVWIDKKFDDYKDFREAFFQFYKIIGIYVSEPFKEKYYDKMKELRDLGKTEISVVELANDLKDNNKIQFSFATKLLNIVDDEKYPIYDSYVVKAFGFPIKYGSLKQYSENYKIITETYKSLLLDYECKKMIETFRKMFPLSEKLSNMRILDFIVWKIGEQIKKGNLKK